MHLTKFSSQNLSITMLGMDNRKFAIEHYTCYASGASFGKWERIPIILTATAILSKMTHTDSIKIKTCSQHRFGNGRAGHC